jgi:DNA-binding transcriptional ArsR family regulator
MSPRRSVALAAVVNAAPVFAALGDPTRLALVTRLCGGGPASIARLTAGAGVSRQAVSKHLRALEQAALVRCTRQGREQIYALEPRRLEAARQCLERISRDWDAALGRLQAFVEDGGA